MRESENSDWACEETKEGPLLLEEDWVGEEGGSFWKRKDGVPQAFLNEDGLCASGARSTSDQEPLPLSTSISYRPFACTSLALDLHCLSTLDYIHSQLPSPPQEEEHTTSVFTHTDLTENPT